MILALDGVAEADLPLVLELYTDNALGTLWTSTVYEMLRDREPL